MKQEELKVNILRVVLKMDPKYDHSRLRSRCNKRPRTFVNDFGHYGKVNYDAFRSQASTGEVSLSGLGKLLCGILLVSGGVK